MARRTYLGLVAALFASVTILPVAGVPLTGPRWAPLWALPPGLIGVSLGVHLIRFRREGADSFARRGGRGQARLAWQGWAVPTVVAGVFAVVCGAIALVAAARELIG
jgi:hypothetical protein